MRTFEQTIIHLCAPTLCSVKPACLISVSKSTLFEEYQKILFWNKILKENKKKIKIVRRSENLFLLLIYDEFLIENIIFNEEIKSYLTIKGYSLNQGISVVLCELLSRLSNESIFPHEIGVFLGYPLEDVLGYEKYSGTKSKFSGAWTVYGNVEKAKLQMNIYKECSIYCTRLFECGNDFESICKNILCVRSI